MQASASVLEPLADVWKKGWIKMGLLKLGLLAGAGYLGYKVLTKPTAAPAAPAVAVPVGAQPPTQLLDAMRSRLDPSYTWNVTTGARFIAVTGVRNSQTMVARTFPDLGAALAWVSVGETTGQQAIVNWRWEGASL